MTKKYKTSLFIFRRDLRIQDNLSLHACLQDSDHVVPLFVFNDSQISEDKNEYFSESAFQFMLESLTDLQERFKEQGGILFFENGKIADVIKRAHEEYKINAIYLGEDYTPFSVARDKHIREVCLGLNIDFHQKHDLILTNPRDIRTGGGTPYKVFTPFKNTAKREIPVPKPITVDGGGQWIKTPVSFCVDHKDLLDVREVLDIPFLGGRTSGLDQMNHIGNLANYNEDRNFPSKKGTTKLSPHLKFGTISVREVYHCVKKKYGSEHTIITELYWRDFYAHLSFHFPYVFGNAFKEQYSAIPWDNRQDWFDAWCKGETGFPIVDAGMRELNETGWMHNRVRMVVASFLVKDLHIDWRWGEKYFANKLVDYDPATNNGSWQWAASTGADAQPYFRIFNPWSQQLKFDKDCIYIKEWIPELRGLSAREIHKLGETPLLIPDGYVRTIVDHRSQAERAKEMFKMVVKK